MDLYAENILQHYKNPVHKREIVNATVTHEEMNHSCGDKVSLQLRIKEGVIDELGWTGEGCAVSQGGMSILAEELIGKKVDDAEAITTEKMKELLGVPIGARRFKCAFLGLHTLKNALRILEKKEPQSWTETVGNA